MLLFNTSFVNSLLDRSPPQVELDENVKILQERAYFREILHDYLLQENLGDLLVKDSGSVEADFIGKKLYGLAVLYPEYDVELLYFHSGLAVDRKVSYILMPTYDGNNVIEVSAIR